METTSARVHELEQQLRESESIIGDLTRELQAEQLQKETQAVEIVRKEQQHTHEMEQQLSWVRL